MFTSIDEIDASLIKAGFAPSDIRLLSSLAKPSVWLETHTVESDDEIAVGATKIGGRPDLPAGTTWPTRTGYPDAEKRTKLHREWATAPDGTWKGSTPEQCAAARANSARQVRIIEGAFPLPFLAQINFTEIWAAGPVDPDMPRSGLLSIFYDHMEQPWGEAPADRTGFAILFHDGSEALMRLEEPLDIRTLPASEQLAPLACIPRSCTTPLPRETAAYEMLGLPGHVAELLRQWWFEGGEASASEEGENWRCHRVGGWPTPIQDDMQAACALVSAGHQANDKAPELAAVRATAAEWLLLAQIGTDCKIGMQWGDDGQVYIWIRRDDLRARRFERAHLILQSY